MGDTQNASSSSSSSATQPSYAYTYLEQANKLQTQQISELQRENQELFAMLEGGKSASYGYGSPFSRSASDLPPLPSASTNTNTNGNTNNDGFQSTSSSASEQTPGATATVAAGGMCDVTNDKCGHGTTCVAVGDHGQCKLADIAKMLNP